MSPSIDTYKIAFAAFLHDIGKFIERAKPDISPKFLADHENLYQPKWNGRHTHRHATYTAYFIKKLEDEILKNLFRTEEWKKSGDFMNLSARHHQPETAEEWIIAMADRIASGFDRERFDDYNKEISHKGIPIRDYRKTRLVPIFEQIFSNKELPEEYSYPLKEISPESIFPEKNQKGKENEYKGLYENFLKDVYNLSHRKDIALWFEHIESLFQIYASHIPAASVGYIIPDVSLFDHCKITSALASALYLWHKENSSMEVEKIKDEDEKKLLIINGNFYGIQNFIFTEGGETNKNSAKLLRGRSFAVSLYTELAADLLCREIGIPSICIVLNDAGKFTILAPNTEKTKEAIEKAEKQINDWLIKKFYGEVSIGMTQIEASLRDFQTKEGRFKELWKQLREKVEERKFSKFDLNKYGGVISDYLKSFTDKGICQFCGKRLAEFEKNLGEENISICGICYDHIFLGENIVKKEKIAIVEKDGDIKGEKLQEPVFDKYQISFPTGDLSALVKERKLLKYWDISIREDGRVSKEITAKFINGYVPKFTGEENEEELLNRIMARGKSEETKEELLNDVKEKAIKNFLFLAKYSLNKTDKPEKFKGIEALGILKADIDNLGKIFGAVKFPTLSRYATLSRQLNNFFTIYLPHLLKTEKKFENIYTIFAGGDDLFLVGPWNRIIELSIFIRQRFKEYVCENKNITISAGIELVHPSESVKVFAEKVEKHLEDSKKLDGKNAITVFGETAKWDEFLKLEKEVYKKLKELYEQGIFKRAMLYKLLKLSELAEKEINLNIKGNYNLKELECLKWRAFLKYTFARNLPEEKISELTQEFANWIEKYKGKMKIPLCWIIYETRGG